MERTSTVHPLTPAMKGKLISLYYSGKTYTEIGRELNINVIISFFY